MSSKGSREVFRVVASESVIIGAGVAIAFRLASVRSWGITDSRASR